MSRRPAPPARLVVLGSILLAAAAGAQRPPRVLLLYDMEGVSGITDPRQTSFRHPDEYRKGREALTSDVNAAIAGLKAAGVSDIVVVDGHGSGNSSEPDVLEDKLLAPAKMIGREGPFDIYMDSYDQSVDAIVAVAMHAGAGNRVGFISHTYAAQDVEYRINGIPFNESMILALGASRLRIPLVMVAGDDQLEKEVRRFMPWVEYAVGKHALDRTRAESFAPAEVQKRIETAARTAIGKLDTMRVFEMPGPYRFALTFQDEAQARNAALVPGAEPVQGGTTVQIRTNDFEDGYRASRRMIGLAGAVSRETALQQALDAQPDGDALRAKMAEYTTDRFLGRVPMVPAPAAPAPPPRYFGAR